MTIAIDKNITGTIFIRNYDEGIFSTLGATVMNTPNGPQYQMTVLGATNNQVPCYFGKPEQHFQKRVFPMVVVDREMTPNLARWMGIGQLQYRAGLGTPIFVGGVSGLPSVSGYGQYQELFQAFPYDMTYTISCWDRYETPVQLILQKVLKVFPPTSTLNVLDSLGLPRTYEAFNEGGPTELHEALDAVTRIRGYAITVRVLGELDLIDPIVAAAVSGFVLRISRQDVIIP